MTTTRPPRLPHAALIVEHLSARATMTRFVAPGEGASLSAFDGGVGSTWVLEGPYSLTTCARRAADKSGFDTEAERSLAPVVYRRFLCTPFGVLVLEPAARFDAWWEGVDASRFDAMTWARDFSPLPLQPFMRDFEADLAGKGIARFFERLAAKQEAMRTVHGAVPAMGQIPYGLREAVLHACAHDETGVLVRVVEEAPKLLVAIGACLGDRPDRWVAHGPRGSELAEPLARLAAGADHQRCLASALDSVTGSTVDGRVVDDLHFLARFVTSAAPDHAWLVARSLEGFDRDDAPACRDAVAWAAWLRTLRPPSPGGWR